MATLYVTEFAYLTPTPNGVAAIAAVPEIAEQTVAIGSGSATPLNPFNAATLVVRLHTDAICSVAFGTSPVATATQLRMAANQTEYFGVPRGAGYTVAVITNV